MIKQGVPAVQAEIEELRQTIAQLQAEAHERERVAARVKALQTGLQKRADIQARHMALLTEVALAVTSATDPTAVLRIALDSLVSGLHADSGSLYILDATQQVLHHHASLHLDMREEWLHFDIGEMPLTARALANGEPLYSYLYEQSTDFVRATRAYIAFSGNIIVPLRARNRPLGVVFVNYHHRTGRTLAEDELAFARAVGTQCALALDNAQLLETVRRERERLAMILDLAPVGIAVWAVDGTLLLANREIHRQAEADISGDMSLAERLHRRVAASMTEDGAQLSPNDYPVQRAMRENTPPPTLLSIQSGDGTRREYIVVARQAPDQSIFDLSQDVNDMRQALRDRIAAQTELELLKQTDKLKTKFMATVSHELRAPLTPILGYAELLTERQLELPTIHNYATIIHNSATRMMRMLEEYLDLQRLEAGAEEFHPIDLSLVNLLADIPQAFIQQCPRLQLQVPELPAVHGDPTKIRRVLENLVNNALKYSPPEEQVALSACVVGNMVEVQVSDRGIGIPADAQRHVFEKFYRVRSVEPLHNQPGSGLGLAIVREIIEMHGGSVGFQSCAGATTFWFRLPIAK